jgi:dTDP-4-dehydrorhamnose 3,5-epimerase
MHITRYSIAGPALIKPRIISDYRGYFTETFKSDWFREHVADVGFVQDNQALSVNAGTVRGLHFQADPLPQGKLVRCLRGAIFDVAVDIRAGSTTFGRWISETLTPDGAEQLWIPEGFMHGYCALQNNTEVFYKVTNPYSPDLDRGIAFDDPDIGIEWPIDRADVVMSDKDMMLPAFTSLIKA